MIATAGLSTRKSNKPLTWKHVLYGSCRDIIENKWRPKCSHELEEDYGKENIVRNKAIRRMR